MSNLYKGPSIDASYQVSVHLAEGVQRRRLKCEKTTDDGCQIKKDISFNVVFRKHKDFSGKFSCQFISI